MEKYLYLRVTWPYNKKFNIVFQSHVKLKLSGFCKTEVVLSWQWRRNGYLKLTVFVSIFTRFLMHLTQFMSQHAKSLLIFPFHFWWKYYGFSYCNFSNGNARTMRKIWWQQRPSNNVIDVTLVPLLLTLNRYMHYSNIFIAVFKQMHAGWFGTICMKNKEIFC